MHTELLYMRNMAQMQCFSKIMKLEHLNERVIIILNQTVFYPQGGGQPYDTGVIKNTDGSFAFRVTEVRFQDGDVLHIGLIEKGEAFVGMEVACLVDQTRRVLNSRLHSAGHVIDMALQEMGMGWIPGKGYHFPDGSYVEYSGVIDGLNTENVRLKIEQKCAEIISRNIETAIDFESDALQNGKPKRTVYYGNYGVPCGGTHVSCLAEIVSIGIRKIKRSKDAMRVSYNIG